MLRFAFETMDEPPVRVDASHGYVLGANDLSVAGELTLRPGKLDCASELDVALAVNVECETRSMGRLALSTCLLQQRHERYALLQELARHRIKLFIAKCEEWQVWDHPGCAAAIAQWNDARSDFTASMTSADGAEADRKAALALVKGRPLVVYGAGDGVCHAFQPFVAATAPSGSGHPWGARHRSSGRAGDCIGCDGVRLASGPARLERDRADRGAL
ncbi:MAG: hypothetical protein EBR10_05520 [Planctomycetes bacterium]|nr:hypothetical protein [Planctomycetota bacterium]